MKTASDLLAEFREEVDDLPAADGSTVACLWSDAEIYRYMNLAASETARRVDSYRKHLTFTIAADTPMVKLPETRILQVHRAWLAQTGRLLAQGNISEDIVARDYGYVLSSPAFETTTGNPFRFYLDYQPGYLRLFPIPTNADTLNLLVSMVPPEITDGMPLPFSDADDQYLMLLFMKYRAYNKHDADTFNPGKAQAAKQEFDALSRERNAEFRRQTRAPGTVRPEW